MNEKKNRSLFFSILMIAVLVIVVVGATYAIFQFQKTGDKKQQVTTGTLTMVLHEGDGISVENALPQSDEVGQTTDPYTFTVENTGSLAARYRVRLIDDLEAITEANEQNNLVEHSKIKYELIKNDGEGEVALLSTLDPSMTLDTSLLSPKASNTYSLRLWIDSDAGNEVIGKVYYGKVVIEAIQNDSAVDFED